MALRSSVGDAGSMSKRREAAFAEPALDGEVEEGERVTVLDLTTGAVSDYRIGEAGVSPGSAARRRAARPACGRRPRRRPCRRQRPPRGRRDRRLRRRSRGWARDTVSPRRRLARRLAAGLHARGDPRARPDRLSAGPTSRVTPPGRAARPQRPSSGVGRAARSRPMCRSPARSRARPARGRPTSLGSACDERRSLRAGGIPGTG